MDRIAKQLIKLAKELEAIDFGTKEEAKKYFKQHPDADKSKHKIVKKEKGEGKKKSVKEKLLTREGRKIAKKNNLQDDDVEEVAAFEKRFKNVKRLTPAELKAKFLKEMSPGAYDSPEAFKNAQKRIKGMSDQDFKELVIAVKDDDEE